MCSGVPADEIRVEYLEYDENGKVIDRFVWPDDADEDGIISAS